METERYADEERTKELAGPPAASPRREITMAILVAVLAMGVIVTALLLATAVLPPR